jgi:hypothetical protein
MNEGINLLPNQAKFRALRSALQKKINLFMWLFGVGMTLTALVVIGFLVFSRTSLNGLIKKQNALNMELKTMSDVFTTSWAVKYRAKIVGNLLSDRFEYGESIEKVNDLFSKKVSVNSLEIRGINDFLIDAEAKNDEGINEIEALIEEVKNKENEDLDNVNLISLSKSGSTWKFKMEVKLK